MKIGVWDDDEEAAAEWSSELEGVLGNEVTVYAAKATDIEAELRILHERRRRYIEGKEHAQDVGDSELDDVDILIVDNDLFDMPHLNDLSAETVANRVGVYTDCASIVVLNLNPDIDFDLRLLGHPESKADVHINDGFVADPGLWHTCPRKGGAFRPWDWPMLSKARVLHGSRVDEVTELLGSDEGDMPILDFLGFGPSSRIRLSRSARAFLHPVKRAEDVSFRDFIDGNEMAVSRIDGQQIVKRGDSAIIARVCARRIATWLARYALGPQDVLVDLPHVVENMPFVVPVEEQESADFWSSCAGLGDAPVWLVDQLDISIFEKEGWLDRPAFWADGLESEENVAKLLGAPKSNPQSLVFCEDASCFFPAADCDQFVAAYNSMTDRRFVRWLDDERTGRRYGPQSRLAR